MNKFWCSSLQMYDLSELQEVIAKSKGYKITIQLHVE